MKVRWFVLACVVLLFSSVPCLALETRFATGLHTTWWQNDNDDTGLQMTMPIQAGITMGAFTAQLLNALVYTAVEPDAGDKATLTHVLDTKLDCSYTVSQALPFDLLLGCGFNLPTGYTKFKSDDMALLALPPDLLPISVYGEGFNVNPYLAASKEWDRIVAGIGLGYLWRGEYDYSETILDYDAGEVLTMSASVGYDFTPALTGRLFGEYATYGNDTVDGEDYYQDGDLHLLGGGLVYTQTAWKLSGSLHAIFRSKAEFYSSTATPIDDKKNLGDEWETLVNYCYFLNSRTTLTAGIDYLFIAENDYAPETGLYNGERRKATISGGMERAFTDKIKGTLRLDLFTMQDDKNWYHPAEDYRYSGLSLLAGLSAHF